MKIIIFGSGAIGSLFGALLSMNNDVLLLGRKSHINAIKNNGLTIKGKTNFNVKINAESSFENITFSPDLLILTVKSYDTEEAIKQAKKIIDKDTKILSLQNGLDNIEKISNHIKSEKIIAGITTHGAFFSKPGSVNHTGIGLTVLGDLNNTKTNFLETVVKLFNETGIETRVSKNISEDIWGKAIINSSINPLTSIFQCKNGYLLENPILEKLLENICIESTSIANNYGIEFSVDFMIKKTKDVIKNTAENFSSMLQSLRNNKKTEIDSINGKLAFIGKEYNVDTTLNDFLVRYIKSLL
jgi:2-dehydropantoate 2-reductase